MAEVTIPQKYRDLFNKRAFACLATLMPNGDVQVTPVWVDADNGNVIFNSARGRLQPRRWEHFT